MPEDVTVEDVEQLHIDAWQLGLKAVAIYRDNCKVAQPLAMAKKERAGTACRRSPPLAARRSSSGSSRRSIVNEPVREKLPRTRTSQTFEFRVADCKGFVTVGEYDDGRPGEIFLRVSKQGSTLAGIMDAFAISVSHGLQYGVPLRSFVEAFTDMRFEPAGMTDDPDIRIANSLMDYLFRRLAVDYLSLEERAELGILTVGERTAAHAAGRGGVGHRDAPGPTWSPTRRRSSRPRPLVGADPSSGAAGSRAASRTGSSTPTPRCACSAASRCSGPAAATPAPAAAPPAAAAETVHPSAPRHHPLVLDAIAPRQGR